MEEKERELKRQKELIEKQAKVKAMRDAAPARKNVPVVGLGSAAIAALGSGNPSTAASANNGLAPQRVVALQVQILLIKCNSRFLLIFIVVTDPSTVVVVSRIGESNEAKHTARGYPIDNGSSCESVKKAPSVSGSARSG
jgi:hypothetical protein